MSRSVLAILDTYPVLSETFLYTTLENLGQAGFNILICARRKGRATHLQRFKHVKFLPSEDLAFVMKTIFVGWYAFKLLAISPSLMLRTIRYLQKQPGGIRKRGVIAFRIFPLLCEKADVIYLSFGGLAAKYLEFIELNPNVVFSLRGSDININPLLSDEYAERLKKAIHAARGIHCVCCDIRLKAMEISGEQGTKFIVIHTAIHQLFLKFDLIKRLSEPMEPTRIISVGRLDWRKGFEHGMVAIRSLVDQGINLSWTIIGEGEYRTALSWTIKDMGLEEQVKLAGGKSQEEIRSLLCQSDIFFHPAVHEGISNAVLEAMAIGLPVVATQVGGMREAIPSGEYGFLVSARDWQGMADALQRLIHNPELRKKIGQNASRYVEDNFSAQEQIEGFMNLLQLDIQPRQDI